MRSTRLYMYKDRLQAGQVLAERLVRYEGQTPVVLAIPRGGIQVAYPIAARLRAELDLVIPRKLPIPGNPEAGFGAITEDGTRVLNEDMVQYLGLTDWEIDSIANRVLEEVRRRTKRYRGDKPFPEVKNKIAIIVDDGLATGYTALAAVDFVKKMGPEKVVVVVPVSSKSAENLIKSKVDDYICPLTSDRPWFAVASFYTKFYDLTDDEVLNCLHKYQIEKEKW
jgi:putative phosphoribosyl transferase